MIYKGIIVLTVVRKIYVGMIVDRVQNVTDKLVNGEEVLDKEFYALIIASLRRNLVINCVKRTECMSALCNS